MRRFALTLLVTLAFVPAAIAGPVWLGIRAGSSIPDLRDNGGNELSQDWSSRVAPLAGVTAEWELRGPWSLRTGLDWAAQGGKRNGVQPVPDPTALGMAPGTPAYANFDHESRLTYVELPLLAAYRFPGPARVQLAFGPYAGLLVSAKEVTSGSSHIYSDKGGTTLSQNFDPSIVVPFDATTDIKDALHSVNFGLQAGLSASQAAFGGRVQLEVRGGLGLTDLQKDSADGKNTTGNLVVSLGYARAFGR